MCGCSWLLRKNAEWEATLEETEEDGFLLLRMTDPEGADTVVRSSSVYSPQRHFVPVLWVSDRLHCGGDINVSATSSKSLGKRWSTC